MTHVPYPEERRTQNIEKTLEKVRKNMESIYFTIEGTPIEKQRHRSTTVNGYSRNYNPSEKDEENFLAKTMAILGNIEMIKGPIRIECFFYFKRPNSHFGTGRNLGRLKNNAPSFHIKRPDIDNLEKFLFDSLNGYLWKDDSQIYKSSSIKAYLRINDIEKTIVNIYYEKQE